MKTAFACAALLTVAGVDAANDPVDKAFDEALRQSYEELFASAARLEFSQSEIDARRKKEEQGKDRCRGKFKDRARELEREIKDAESDLRKRTHSLTGVERREIHCSLLELRARRAQAEHFHRNVIPNAYDNRIAKLMLIEQWPEEELKIREEIRTGAHLNRKWGAVKDVGFRGVGEGQEDDIKKGSEAIDEMRRNGMLPREMTDEQVAAYVTRLAEAIASHSDLRVPVKVSVLESPEINAFALPGGFLFVHRGLLEATDTEAQLAGVIAHEIAHAAARHGHRLMRRATIAGIFYQAAQVVALIFTGGAVGVGTYYALQYGFYGLGLALSLELLGVSRDYEMEADQLGIQYAWNAGYDPAGFIQFFDRMATREGYITGASWFRTHPPFYARMVVSQREIRFLPERETGIVQTTEFERIRARLKQLPKKTPMEKAAPSLEAPGHDCPKPKLEFSADDPLEKLCAGPES